MKNKTSQIFSSSKQNIQHYVLCNCFLQALWIKERCYRSSFLWRFLKCNHFHNLRDVSQALLIFVTLALDKTHVIILFYLTEACLGIWRIIWVFFHGPGSVRVLHHCLTSGDIRSEPDIVQTEMATVSWKGLQATGSYCAQQDTSSRYTTLPYYAVQWKNTHTVLACLDCSWPLTAWLGVTTSPTVLWKDPIIHRPLTFKVQVVG